MNIALGQLVQMEGVAGLFPWQLNYDTVLNNNSLFPWLLQGLLGPTPPPTPPPTPGNHTPIFFPIKDPVYVYQTRDDALASCKEHGFVGLCIKADLNGHELCKAGWTSDWEGYWMASTVTGCGEAGYNEWHGAAGAYCCELA
eukprot:m.783918 g.783918  ORF g.783918 m.783918 type:complete len:142 (+) comp23295_c0_seq18:1015-1440(+)